MQKQILSFRIIYKIKIQKFIMDFKQYILIDLLEKLNGTLQKNPVISYHIYDKNTA